MSAPAGAAGGRRRPTRAGAPPEAVRPPVRRTTPRSAAGGTPEPVPPTDQPGWPGSAAAVPQLALRLGWELLGAAGRRAAEVVPPEAQVHLLRAQHELWLAAAAVVSRGRTGTERDPADRPRSRRIVVD